MNGEAEEEGPPVSSRAAAWSMALGVVSYLLCLNVLTGIPAIICGHRGWAAIKASGGALGGKHHAVIGLVLGYLTIPLLFAIYIPLVSSSMYDARVVNLRDQGLSVFKVVHGGEGFELPAPGKFATSTEYFEFLVERGVLRDTQVLRDRKGRLLWSVVEVGEGDVPVTPFMISANVNIDTLADPLDATRLSGEFPGEQVVVIYQAGHGDILKGSNIARRFLNPGDGRNRVLRP